MFVIHVRHEWTDGRKDGWTEGRMDEFLLQIQPASTAGGQSNEFI